LVGARGFEPPTPCAQGRCATRLRYAPTWLIINLAALIRCSVPPSRRYNVSFMTPLLYSAIAYVRSPVGIFVEQLRREFHPAHTHADAHMTILPPRPLGGSEQQAVDLLTEVCRAVAPFEVTMGDVETFLPLTPTVFIRVARGAYRMRELRDSMNRDVLYFEEPWPYMPHLTIVKADAADEVPRMTEIARQRWQEYSDTRKIRISKLSFVKGTGERWVDLATMQLGNKAGG
jgi:2'-5' RNA ligase